MTIMWLEDFESYGTGFNPAPMLEGNYAGIFCTVDTDPITGTNKCAVFTTAATASEVINRWVLPVAAQLIVGSAKRVYLTALPTQDGNSPILFQPRTVANVQIASVTIDTTGRVQIRAGDSSGAILATSTLPVFVPLSWQHVECKISIDNLIGSLEVRVEGVTVLSIVNQNFGILPCGQMATGSKNYGFIACGTSYKDLVYWNGLGAQNNNFMGSVLVKSLLPTADIALNWALTGVASGFLALDNSPPNNAQYISADVTLPAAYVASLSNLPDDITSVKGVMTKVRAAKVDGGDATLQIGLISGASTGLGAARPISTANIYYHDVFELNPATAAAWTPTTVDAAQLRISRTA